MIRRRGIIAAAVSTFLVGAALTVPSLSESQAATPSSGTVGAPPDSPSVTWTGPEETAATPFQNVTGIQDESDAVCAGPAGFCDDFTLTVSVEPSYWETHIGKIDVAITWMSSDNDFDLYVYQDGEFVESSAAGGTTSEQLEVFKPSGTYLIRIVYFSVIASGYSGLATFTSAPLGEPPSPPPPPPPTPGVPRYQNYVSPTGLGGLSGEPTIGVNWKTDKVMYIAFFDTMRISFDDCTSPAKASWVEKTAPNTSVVTADPILFTDSHNIPNLPNRCFASQLAGKTSLMSFTDDDGETWIPSQGGGINSGIDHQTVGAGPYKPGMGLPPPGSPYPRAIYYCSQDLVDALCARSDNGGATFGSAIPIYTFVECGGIHGHIKVAPASAPSVGTVYVPNRSCGGGQAVVVSEDNGLTWEVRQIPDSLSTPRLVDPSVGIGKDGTIYFAYQNRDGRAKVAVSGDKGATWTQSQDLGVPHGIVNTVFPAVIAGDDERAAVAFLGTTTPGDYEDPGAQDNALDGFQGVWHLYISTTFDGGQTWTTINATPNDPVQRGSICTKGTLDCVNAPDDRNLLDFIDAQIDAQGRVLVPYADGCLGACVTGPPNSFTSKAALARQSGGRRLFAAFDPAEPSAPGAPLVTGTRDVNGTVNLSWPEPDHGGSAITEYRVYRSTSSDSGFSLLGTTTLPKFVDSSADPGTQFFYRVTAVNGIGEGPFCGSLVSPLPETPCVPPGLTVLTDPTGDALDAQPSHDIQRISVAEPFFGAGVKKLVFTLKVASLSTVPPDTTWPVTFKSTDGKIYFVAMRTSASGAVTFVYGEGRTGAATPLGNLDPASGFKPDGTIALVIANDKVGNPAAGQALVEFLTRIRVEGGPAGAVTPDNAPNDLAPGGTYTLFGNVSCGPNAPPIAVLKASPREGERPLTTNFDASDSSDPDGDSIVSYTFNPGDGSPEVTHSTPTFSHTYDQEGEFHARLNVTDSRGEVSVNVAQVVIEVGIQLKQLIPEGTTRAGFSTFLLLANPSQTDRAEVKITLLTNEGPVTPPSLQELEIGPGARATVSVNEVLDGRELDVGARIISFGAPVVASSSVHKSGSLATMEVSAASSASNTWILPEGATHSGFSTFVSIVNPDVVDTEVDVDYLTGSGGEVDGPDNLLVPAGSRVTLQVNAATSEGGCDCSDDVSTRVNVAPSQAGVVAGMSIQKTTRGDLGFGGSLGIPGPAETWLVAEGATHTGWHTFVLVANPGPSEAVVNVTYLTGGQGAHSDGALTIPAGSRRTIDVNARTAALGLGVDDVSVLIEATTGAVAVEGTIQKLDSTGFVIADSAGSGGTGISEASGTLWLSPEGATHSGFTTFILISNPQDTPATVRVNFLTPAGLVLGPQNLSIPARSRKTFAVNDFVPNQDVATLIHATTGRVAVEMVIDRAIQEGGFSKGRALAFRLGSAT